MLFRSQDPVSKFDMDVSADDVFEVVAHLVQAQAIETGQSEKAANKFLGFILNSPEKKHLLPWRKLYEKGLESITRATELFTWMLIGSWKEMNSSGHPANRYFQVLKLAFSSPDDV